MSDLIMAAVYWSFVISLIIFGIWIVKSERKDDREFDKLMEEAKKVINDMDKSFEDLYKSQCELYDELGVDKSKIVQPLSMRKN